MFDYEVLRLIWWGLIGVLLIGFMITDGFDMGVGALLPVIGKTNVERRVMLNSIAPHWDGNQVWLITAGGALFAAWPLVYAVSFSSLYMAMYLVLISLWLRPLAFDYRSKVDSARWRQVCDLAISFSGFFPPILFGVAFGNLMQGLPFTLNSLLISDYHGTLIDLINPFALLCGLVGLLMALLQGGAWLMLKTTDAVYKKARAVTQVIAVLIALIMVLGYVAINHINGYVIISSLDHSSVSNPLNKEVVTQGGAWLNNFDKHPWTWSMPFGCVVIPLLALIGASFKWDVITFISSSLTNVCIILTAGISMFPFIIPSSVNPSHSLTLWDSTSSELTLNIMTGVALVMVPIILCYTVFCYRTMFGRIDAKYIERNSHSLY